MLAGLSFASGLLRSDIGKIGLALAAFLAWTHFQRVDAAQDAKVAFELQIAERQREMQDRIAEIEKTSRVRAEVTKGIENDLRQKLEDAKKQFRENPPDCVFTPDDIKRLQSIRPPSRP